MAAVEFIQTDEEKTSNEIDANHFKRRRQILAAHPELRDLFNVIDPSLRYVSIACSLTNLLMAILMRDADIALLLLFTMFVGPAYNCAIGNACHEIVHDLAIAGSPLANKIVGGIVNLGLGWPFIGHFYRTHRNHHSYLGSDLDIKYPSIEEAMSYDQTVWGRLKFIFLRPLHCIKYGSYNSHNLMVLIVDNHITSHDVSSVLTNHMIKVLSKTNTPFYKVGPKIEVMFFCYRSGDRRWEKMSKEEHTPFAVWNFRTVWLCNFLVFYFFGLKSIFYILASYWLHESVFIQGAKTFTDHYCEEDQAYAVSYYGWVNYFNHNIGYHREHHDFPSIPGRYFPEITRIAKEFYMDPKAIDNNLFGAVWRLLIAKPGKGLIKHANKLSIKQVSAAPS